jgi:hypothetical protein
MIKKYELRDSSGDLVRVFMSHEEAVKCLTSGDYLVEIKTIQPPKVSLYEQAIKKGRLFVVLNGGLNAF